LNRSCVDCDRFSYYVSIGFILLLLVFTFFSVLPKIGWKEHPQNDLFYVEWDIKHLLDQSIVPLYLK